MTGVSLRLEAIAARIDGQGQVRGLDAAGAGEAA
jgi:hypothetical protein